MEFGALPINYLTKSQTNPAFGSYLDAIRSGYNIGGDAFRYEGAIVSMTDAVLLMECDLYPNRQATLNDANRGPNRLVFSADGNEVFHTTNHYETFVRLTWLGIQWRFAVSIVIFVAYTGGVVWMFAIFHKRNILTLNELKADGIAVLLKMKEAMRLSVRIAQTVVFKPNRNK